MVTTTTTIGNSNGSSNRSANARATYHMEGNAWPSAGSAKARAAYHMEGHKLTTTRSNQPSSSTRNGCHYYYDAHDDY